MIVIARHHLLLKLCAIKAVAMAFGTAVALAERFAAFVLFQRYQPRLPPTQNVDSAPRSRTSACHFSGNSAICAITATAIAFRMSKSTNHQALFIYRNCLLNVFRFTWRNFGNLLNLYFRKPSHNHQYTPYNKCCAKC
jgi:hypothetical protein